jgi:hypothetical protein
MEDACVADDDTRARIAKIDWTVRAPKGWRYAQEPEFTVASSERAILAMTTYPEPDKKRQESARDATLAGVVHKLGVVFPKRKKLVFPRKVDKTIPVGTLKVGLVQLDGARLAKKRGPVLAFEARLPNGQIVLGAAFVPDDDTSNADQAILASIESIAPPSPASEEPDADRADRADRDGGAP